MSEKGTGPGEEGRAKPRASKALLIVAGIFLLYITTVQVWHYARSFMVETGALSTGELKKLYPAEGLLIRDETVIPSPADGELVMLVKPGERVRAGESIAEVKTAGEGTSAWSSLVQAPRTGIVSLAVDGLEGVLNPGQADILKTVGLNEVNTKQRIPLREVQTIKCYKGQPVIKVIDNLSPLLICLPAPDGFPGDALKKGGSIVLLWDDSELAGRIKDDPAGNNAAGRMLIVQASNYPAGLLNIRKDNFYLVGERFYGYIVPQRSLVIRDGRVGLYIMNKQRGKWVPVKVEGIVDGHAAVTGDQLAPGGRYVINPHWLFTRE
ncbi:MAG: HlyD family efflux transporter periplasmic adaptor subunit [Bacillota bacterium]